MRGRKGGEERQSDHVQQSADTEGGGERGPFAQATAPEQTHTNPYVPRSEVGGGGRATFVVRCERDEQGVHGRENRPVTHTDQECDKKEGRTHIVRRDAEIRQGTQQDVGESASGDPHLDHEQHLTPIHQFAREDTRQSDARGQEEIEEGWISLDGKLLRVQGDERGHDPIRDGEEEKIDARRHPLLQEETIQRELLLHVRLRAVLRLDQATDQEGAEAHAEGGVENRLVAIMVQEPHTHHRARRHGEVVGKSEVAQALAPTAGRHDVDYDRIARYGDHAKGQSVHHAEQGEEEDRLHARVPREEEDKDREGHQIERFALESVHQIPREGADEQASQRIAGKDRPHRGLRHGEDLYQIHG